MEKVHPSLIWGNGWGMEHPRGEGVFWSKLVKNIRRGWDDFKIKTAIHVRNGINTKFWGTDGWRRVH